MEGNLTQDSVETNRALESMSDWYDVIQVVGTTGIAALRTTYPTLTIKGLGNADAADGVVKVKTVNNTQAGFVEIRIPAGGFTGKLPRLDVIGASGDGTTITKLLLFVQKVA
jgi:hypothetical protein